MDVCRIVWFMCLYRWDFFFFYIFTMVLAVGFDSHCTDLIYRCQMSSELNQCPSDSNKTIILILQFNDLCSQWEKWIKMNTEQHHRGLAAAIMTMTTDGSIIMRTILPHVLYISYWSGREHATSSWLFD